MSTVYELLILGLTSPNVYAQYQGMCHGTIDSRVIHITEVEDLGLVSM